MCDIRVQMETVVLTDGSRCYDVLVQGVGRVILHAVSFDDADLLVMKIREAINAHTTQSAHIYSPRAIAESEVGYVNL